MWHILIRIIDMSSTCNDPMDVFFFGSVFPFHLLYLRINIVGNAPEINWFPIHSQSKLSDPIFRCDSTFSYRMLRSPHFGRERQLRRRISTRRIIAAGAKPDNLTYIDLRLFSGFYLHSQPVTIPIMGRNSSSIGILLSMHITTIQHVNNFIANQFCVDMIQAIRQLAL
jgi:hypothetical protein